MGSGNKGLGVSGRAHYQGRQPGGNLLYDTVGIAAVRRISSTGTVPTYARPRPESFHDRLDRGPFRPQSPRGEGVPRGRLGGQRENRRPSPVERALAHRPAGGDREYPEAARVDDWRVVEGHPVSLRRTECPGGDESLGVGPVDAGAPDAGERSTSHGRIGAPRARSPLRGNGVCGPGPRTLRVRAAAPESSVNFAESLLPALLFRHGKRDRGAF